MIQAHRTEAFAYAIGEEVVFRLEGAKVFDVDHSVAIPPELTPAWSIGTITSIVLEGASPRYVLRFDFCGDVCMCMAEEPAIEGLA